MLFPYMFQIAAGDERQVVVANDLAIVAHHATSSGCVFYEIQLHHLMAMDGIVELLFMAVGHIHEIVFAQRRYLSQNSCFHVFLFYMLQRYKYLYGVTTPP